MTRQELTAQELSEWKARIDRMTQMEMARLQRFAPVGHPVFDTNLPLWERFEARFKELGGMTPGISKAIGWN